MSVYVKNIFKILIYLRTARKQNKGNTVTAMETFYHQVSETHKQSMSFYVTKVIFSQNKIVKAL